MSRRKQQNPKPILKGDDHSSVALETSITAPNSDQYQNEEDESDPGFPHLVINTEDENHLDQEQLYESHDIKSINDSHYQKDSNNQPSSSSSSSCGENKWERSITLRPKTTDSISSSHQNNDDKLSSSSKYSKVTSNNYNNQVSPVVDGVPQLYYRQNQTSTPLLSDDNNSISSETSQTSSSFLTEVSNSPAAIATSMTRMDETSFVNGVSDYGMITGEDGRTASHIPRPKQAAPNKTRRKSDKIIPVTDATGNAKYVCPVCKEAFDGDSALTKHIRLHNTSSAINTCKICGKVLSSQSSLDRHMLVHSGERPFKCKVCKMAFTTNGNMHRHSRIHDKEVGINMTHDQNKQVENRPRRHFRPTNLQPNMVPNRVPIAYRSQAYKRKSSTESENDFFESPAKRSFMGVDDSSLMDRDNVEPRSSSPDKSAQKKKYKNLFNKADNDEENSEPIQCPICLKPFMCKYGLDIHFDSHLNSHDTARCQLCHVGFQSSKEVYIHYLSSHIDVHKIDGEHKLKSQRKNGLIANDGNELSVGFNELGSLSDFSSLQFPQIAKAWCERNQRKPSSPYHSYYCRKCEHAFPCADALVNHLENHPDECNVSCNVCDVTFTTRGQFEDHVIRHSTENVIKNFSKKIGTDDNDVQDMVSQPEFMLVLGLKTTNKQNSLQDSQIIADVMKARKEKNVEVNKEMDVQIMNEIIPMVIEPIKREVEPTMHANNTKQLFQKSVKNQHPAFPRRLAPINHLEQFVKKPPVRRHHSPSDISSSGTNEKEPVEIASSSDDEAETEMNAERPWQCVICEFAYPSRTQCIKHCRKHHGLNSSEEVNSAVSYNPFSRLVINAKPPAWSFKPFLCKLCKNGFTTKENGIKHMVVQHGVNINAAERHIAVNKLLQGKARGFPPGISETVKRIQHAAQQQKMMSQMSWSPKNVARNNPDIPAVLTGPYSKMKSDTFITSPPITHPRIKTEPNDTEFDEQPLDFSMKKNTDNKESQKRNPQEVLAQGGSRNGPITSGSGEEPMDLTLKINNYKEDTDDEDIQPPSDGYFRSSLSSVGGVNMSSPHLNKHSQQQQLKKKTKQQLASQTMSLAAAADLMSPAALAARQRFEQMQQQQLLQQQLAPIDPDQQALFRYFNAVVGKFQCPYCHMFFKHGGQLQNHIQSHHSKGQNTYLCNQCPASFTTNDALDRHLVSKHPQSERHLRKGTTRSNNEMQVSPGNKSQQPKSTSPISNRTNTIPTQESNNSDPELSSVSSMLDATNALNFKAFLSQNTHTTVKTVNKQLNESREGSVTSETHDDDIQSSDKSQTKDKKVKRNSYSDSPHKLQCPYCPRAFPWISSLKRHILTHTGQKPYKCPECSVTFSTKSNRERHMVRKHGMNIHDPATRQAMEKPYQCHVCNDNFTCATVIQKHYKEAHTDTTIPDFIIQQAKFEGLPAVNLSQDKLDLSMLDNLSTISGDPSEGVDSSLIDFEDEDEDEGSVKSFGSSTSPSKNNPFSLPNSTPVSNASSPVPLQIPQPLIIQPIESNVSTIPDTTTQAVPEYLNKINPERDNYNVDRITRCWKCNANFDSRKVLLRHLKEHNIDNSFKCYLCDASYDSREECLDHTMQYHPHDWVMLREKNKCYNIAEYSENMEKLVMETIENLGLSEINNAVLAGIDVEKNGVKGADGEEKDGAEKPDSDYAQRKVFCSFCVKRFWSLQDLRRHMRSHTGERPFECDVCQKRFTLKHSMMRHRRKHTPAELAEAASPLLSASDEDTNDGNTVNPVHSNLRVALFTRRRPDTDNKTPVTIPVEGHTEVITPVSAVQETNEDEDNSEQLDRSDMLHNLLGIESSQIDELITSANISSAAHVLGMDGKNNAQ